MTLSEKVTTLEKCYLLHNLDEVERTLKNKFAFNPIY